MMQPKSSTALAPATVNRNGQENGESVTENGDKSGIFNCGTGVAQTFNDVANAVIDWHGSGEIRYIPFPEHLVGAYQSFTEADLTALRAAGCDVEFRGVADGVEAYLDQITD